MIADNSIVSVWKPKDVRSTQVVNLIKSKYSLKTGHAGTLDPFAEGVLLICTGDKTKKVPEIHKLDKSYIAKIKLGERTDTLDVDGEIIQKEEVPCVEEKELIKVLKSFEAKTGIGAILNTSFNLHGYPIGYNPELAIKTFTDSDLNYLAIGNYLIKK